MRRTLQAAAAGTILLLAACGTSTPVGDGEPATNAHDGSMTLQPDFSDGATPLERSGAAGLALECDGAPYTGGGGDYVDGGLESVQDSPQEAVDNWLDNEAWAYQIPESGYRVERDDGDRVLLSYDVGDQTKIAFVTADGIRDYNDDEGWGVESWGGCDPAELPAAVTDELGIGVWEDAFGQRVPVSETVSFQGPEHCGWQDITFLYLGTDGEDGQYLRDVHAELGHSLQTTYDGTSALPRSATDTGLHRDGRQLWLSAGDDAAYLVSLNDPGDVERWPAAKRPVGCA